MSDPLMPNPTLLIKLGSIIVHYKEFCSPTGNVIDKETVDAMLQQTDVKEWMEEMDRMALLPKERGH